MFWLRIQNRKEHVHSYYHYSCTWSEKHEHAPPVGNTAWTPNNLVCYRFLVAYNCVSFVETLLGNDS